MCAQISQHEVQQNLVRSGAKYVDSAKQDIMSALGQFSGLRPDSESFLFPDGKRRQAFFLNGTIPVSYKGSVYNIPIRVYLWDTHPYYAPICFVRPTSDMVIRESESVNKEGRVYLPYLNEWRFPGYDLHGLLQVMSLIFQERCPVFAKSSSQRPVSQPTGIPTPYPTGNPTAMPTPYPMNGAGVYNPATPYPNAGNNQFPSPYVNPPMPSPFTGAGYVGRPAPPIPPQPTDHIRESILSALQDRMRSRFRENLGTAAAEMASIAQTKKDLQAGQSKIKRIVQELESTNANLNNFISTYEAKKGELSRALSQAGGGATELNIDSVIEPSNPLHRQLLHNYAQDLSCDDEIYALGKAKSEGAISLQDYLRHVRVISRRQFEYRATMQKCRKVAGLPA